MSVLSSINAVDQKPVAQQDSQQQKPIVQQHQQIHRAIPSTERFEIHQTVTEEPIKRTTTISTTKMQRIANEVIVTPRNIIKKQHIEKDIQRELNVKQKALERAGTIDTKSSESRKISGSIQEKNNKTAIGS